MMLSSNEIGELIIRVLPVPKLSSELVGNPNFKQFVERWGFGTKIDGYQVADKELEDPLSKEEEASVSSATILADFLSSKTKKVASSKTSKTQETPESNEDDETENDDGTDYLTLEYEAKLRALASYDAAINAREEEDFNIRAAWQETIRGAVAELPVEMKNYVLISAPMNITVDELKVKLYATLPGDIEPKRLLLLYQGETLKNGRKCVPRDAFERTAEDFNLQGNGMLLDDFFLFRPRLCVGILQKEIEVEVEEEESDPGEEEPQDFRDDTAFGVIVKVDEVVEVVAKYDDKFRLERDMKKIDCEMYTEQLENWGYGDEGAFSEITEEDLSTLPLVIPRRVRVRIMNLADTIKRRLNEEDKIKSNTKYKMLETQMHEGGQLSKVSVDDGTGRVFNKKSDINKAFAQDEKEKKRLANLKRFGKIVEEVVDPDEVKHLKKHSEALAMKIATIRKDYKLDEDGIYENYLDRINRGRAFKTEYCCNKHRDLCEQNRTIQITERKVRNQLRVQLAVDRVPGVESGILPKHVAWQLGDQLLSAYGDYHLPSPSVYALLEQVTETCRMTSHNEDKVHWRLPDRDPRAARARVLSGEKFDSTVFVRIIVEVMETLDKERL